MLSQLGFLSLPVEVVRSWKAEPKGSEPDDLARVIYLVAGDRQSSCFQQWFDLGR
jgi:hypothetical protein